MRLINLDDLTVFGAGSEWFWTMLTMVALTVTFVAISRQLRAQRAANALEQLRSLNEEWLSERMRHVCLRLAMGLRYGTDAATETFAGNVDNFFRKLELLHRQGYLDTELLWTNFGEDVVRYWTVTARLAEDTRRAYDSPNEFGEWERLMVVMRDLMARRGFPPFATDAESIKARLDWIIEGHLIALRFNADVREGVIPTPPARAIAAAAE